MAIKARSWSNKPKGEGRQMFACLLTWLNPNDKKKSNGMKKYLWGGGGGLFFLFCSEKRNLDVKELDSGRSTLL